MAEIPDANVDLLWGGEIQIYFLFDGADRLVGHRLETYTICP